MGKSIDTFCPIGPYVVSKDEIADPHALDIQITVSGEVLQKSNTRELIFKLPKLISYISQVMTLKPGDIITTGTPAGVGLAHKPPRWLRPGDVCVVEVAGLGQLRNPVVLED
jgi:2-keto-4-pentenoate hydratase/2-oxohepta-3-ene-1,7-dioic acid hydratase in catechol pathway